MNKILQTIACPVCNDKISFDTKSLLEGAKFSCPKCQATISLSKESTDIVKQAMEKFENLKNNPTHKL